MSHRNDPVSRPPRPPRKRPDTVIYPGAIVIILVAAILIALLVH